MVVKECQGGARKIYYYIYLNKQVLKCTRRNKSACRTYIFSDNSCCWVKNVVVSGGLLNAMIELMVWDIFAWALDFLNTWIVVKRTDDNGPFSVSVFPSDFILDWICNSRWPLMHNQRKRKVQWLEWHVAMTSIGNGHRGLELGDIIKLKHWYIPIKEAHTEKITARECLSFLNIACMHLTLLPYSDDCTNRNRRFWKI